MGAVLLLGLTLLLPGVLLQADVDPLDILRRSIEKETTVSYVGQQETTVTGPRVNQHIEQIIKHKPPNKLRIEYLAPLQSKGDLLIDDGTTTWYYHRALNAVQQARGRVRGEPPKIPQLRAAVRRGVLTAEYLGETTVAGRKAIGVALTNTQPPEQRREIWFDQEFGVPLKAHDVLANGGVSDSVFTTIQFNPPLPALQDSEFVWTTPPGVTDVPPRGGQPIPPKRAQKIAEQNWGGPLLVPNYPGLQLRPPPQRLNIQGQPVIHLRFSYGKRTISLFESLAGEPLLRSGRGLKGKENFLTFQRGRVNLMIVGPLPIPELQRIADSVR
jgi:outer membrane lipoprotein-sorting protein